MHIDISVPGKLTAYRDIGDPRFGKNESWLLHRVKKCLHAKGINCIKRLAWKDGHLVSDNVHTIRDRKATWIVWDPNYMIHNAAEEFAANGKFTYRVEGVVK